MAGTTVDGASAGGGRSSEPPGAERHERPKGARPKMGWMEFILLYDVIVLGVLSALAVLYFKVDAIEQAFPEEFGKLPLYAVWFGALGGVTTSMKGVYDHVRDWDHNFDLWHLGRPFSGGVVGGITWVLLRAVNAAGQPTNAVVFAAAFVLGAQERRFFQFLYEVGKIVVAVPGDTEEQRQREEQRAQIREEMASDLRKLETITPAAPAQGTGASGAAGVGAGAPVAGDTAPRDPGSI